MEKKLWIKGGCYHVLPSEFSCVTLPKTSWGTLLCLKKFLVSKKVMDRRGGLPRFSIGNFLSHSAETFCRVTLLCFKKFLVSKKFMDKRGGQGGGSITFFYHKLLSHIAQKFRRGTLLFFRKFLVSKIFMPENHDFLYKICCLTVPENFVGERICGSEFFSYQKFFCLRGEYHVFL